MDKNGVARNKWLGVIVAGACLGSWVLAAAAFSQTDWATVDDAAKTIEGDVVSIRYGSPASGYWGNGIVEFVHNATGGNYAQSLNTYGCESATYDRSGPSSFAQTALSPESVEVEVRFNDCIGIIDHRNAVRLFKGLPVLEIEYLQWTETANQGGHWWEDFMWNPDVDGAGSNVVLTVYGSETLVGRSTLQNAYNSGWTNWPNPFNCSWESNYYRDYFIFGAHCTETGRGIGEVLHRSMANTTNCFRMWWSDLPTPNYELFVGCWGAKSTSAVIGYKRWLYIYENGREGMLETGVAIADAAAAGQSMTSLEPATATAPRHGRIVSFASAAPEVSVAFSDGVLRIDVPRVSPHHIAVHDALGRELASMTATGTALQWRPPHAGVFLVSAGGITLSRVVVR